MELARKTNMEKKIFTNEEIEEMVGLDEISLLKKEPFYSYLLVKMQKRIDRSVPVAGVAVIDGDIILYINPEGYTRYTKPERIAILKHEVLHVILIHYLRRGDRDPSLFNVAADIAINQMVNTSDFYLPKDALQPEHFDVPRDKSSEEYYRILWERNEEIKMPPELANTLGQMLGKCPSCGGTGQQQGNGQGQGDGDGDEEGEGEGQGNGQGQGEGEGEGEGQGQGQGNGQHQHGNGGGHSHGNGQPCPHCNGTGKNPGGGGKGGGRAPDFAGLHPTWDRSTDVSEELAEAVVRAMVQDAYEKSQGNVPGNIAQLVSEILESKVNWRAIFRNFVAKRRHTNKKATWKRPNRRLGRQVMGYKKSKRISVFVFVDTSGSVSSEELAMFNGEMQKMYASGAEITVIECDAAIQKVYKYTKYIEPEFRGRGGTDFRPPFEYIKKNNEHPDCIIYLTDGYGHAPDKCNIPVLWALTPQGQRPMAASGGEVSYGACIVLED